MAVRDSLSRRRRPAGATLRKAASRAVLLALVATAALLDTTCMVGADAPTFHRAYFAMGSPVALGLVAGLCTSLRAPLDKASMALAVLATAALHVTTAKEDLALPTNALESALAETWRQKLPPGSTVLYVGRADTHVLALPLYGEHTRVPVEPWVLGPGTPTPDLAHLGDNVYYYESSLCATPPAADLCRDLRARLAGPPIETATLPARPSTAVSPFGAPTVQVSLHRAR
ncbi:MAG: hypothetical protein R3F14_12980 [Polyangiaceae bacterium]